jgi:hypothetical protein
MVLSIVQASKSVAGHAEEGCSDDQMAGALQRVLHAKRRGSHNVVVFLSISFPLIYDTPQYDVVLYAGPISKYE